jgi:hypothetical protein
MNSKQLLESIDELYAGKRAIMERKNSDYAQGDDAFSNFKFSAEFAGVTVEQAFRVLIGVKIARLKELMNGKIPQNERVEDTLVDLSNYADLLVIYLNDTGEKATFEAVKGGE